MVIRGPAVTKAQTHAQHALERLKDKFPASLRYEDLESYTSMNLEDEEVTRWFKKFLQQNSDIKHNAINDTYRFKPPHPIRSADQLIAHFQGLKGMDGIEFTKLLAGWAECRPVIDHLEAEHKLVVLRHKKDNSPRIIFADDPTLHAPLDKDFTDLWNSITLPPKDDVITFLIKAKRTPAGQIAETKAVAKTTQKVRKNRQSTKQTNKHMAHIFKDYSGLRNKK